MIGRVVSCCVGEGARAKYIIHQSICDDVDDVTSAVDRQTVAIRVVSVVVAASYITKILQATFNMLTGVDSDANCAIDVFR